MPVWRNSIIFNLFIQGFKPTVLTLKRFNYLEKKRVNLIHARLLGILIKHCEIEMISDGKKSLENKVSKKWQYLF